MNLKHVFTLLFILLILFEGDGQVKDPIDQKIEELLKQMTLEEKVAMIHANSSFTSAGVKRLNIPELVTSDGPHGVRMEHGRDWTPDNKGNDSVTYLPTGISLASTWNPELGYAFGKVLGSEAKARGKDVILGPGINIMRSPLNGRNFEYLSEDPYLITRLCVGTIKGIQDQEIAACVKHYLANNQELNREKIDVNMSERALREIYLPGFKAAIMDGGAYTIMGAYNQFRGEFCTHNKYLVNDILKGEFGFKGIMMSDWGAVHDTKQALLNGTDLEMGTDLSMLPKPDYNKFFLATPALTMIKNGEVPVSIVDDKVRRILWVMLKTKMFDKRTPGSINTKEHHDIALKIAEEGIILLKNNENILPIKKSIKRISVIGANATKEHSGAGGSSQVNAKYEISPLEGIREVFGSSAEINFTEGYKIIKNGKANQNLINKAVEAAKKSEAVVLVGGYIRGYSNAWNDNAYDAEGQDKPNIQLPFGQNELFEAVIKANPNTIVVLYGGGPIEMPVWGESAKAIIQAGYPGMEGGRALAKILAGKVNPSGKLTVTFPKKLQDAPDHALGEYPGDGKTVHYKDDIFVGYRYYDTYKVAPLFPFGHGLSYTTFSYSDLKVNKDGNNVSVIFTLKNTGNVDGAEVTQVYVKDDESSVKRPEKELKGFEKVFLKAGESKEISLPLKEDAFKFYDEAKKQWMLENGKFTVLVGSSSRDIKLTGKTEF
jgi:beta-glucosidase